MREMEEKKEKGKKNCCHKYQFLKPLIENSIHKEKNWKLMNGIMYNLVQHLNKQMTIH